MKQFSTLVFFCILLLSDTFAQNPGFEQDFTNWNSNSSPWSITSTSGQFRSGTRAALLGTSSTTDFVNRLNSGFSVTTPASGTNYITVIAWVRSSPSNSSSTGAAVGVHNGTVSQKGTEVTGVSSSGFIRISHTFAATNNTTYAAEIYGRSIDGNPIGLYFDDIIIYTSPFSTTDLTNPGQATRINVLQSGTTISFSWTPGSDDLTGIEGALVVRTTGVTPSITVPTAQTFYSTNSLSGPAILSSHNVRTNGNNTMSFSESVTNNTIYTYVIFLRDKAYNYSPFARIILFNGTGLSANITNNTSLDGLFLPSGNTFTILSSSTVTLRASFINIGGTVINQGNLNNSASTLAFSSGSVYNFNRNNSGSFSIVTATWEAGSTCRVTGVTTSGPLGTGQNFANFEWQCAGQTAAFTLSSNFNTTGNFSVLATNSGSLSFPASATNSIGGNFSHTGGTLSFANNNTIQLNGSGAQILTTAGSFQNLTINNGSTVSLGSTVAITKSLHLASGTFNISGHNLNMANNSEINRGNGTFSGTPMFQGLVNVLYTAPVTTGTELPSGLNTLQNLTIQTSGTIDLDQPAKINGQLQFDQGFLRLGSHDLTIGSAGSILGATSSKFIVTDDVGKLVQDGIGPTGKSGPVVFPIGALSGSYTPVSLLNTGTTDSYSARVFPNVYDNYDPNGAPTGAVISSNVVNRSWQVEEETIDGSNVQMTLTWNASNEIGGFNRASSFIARFTNRWNPTSAAGATGSNPYSQSRSGITNFSVFAVGDSNSPLPVELLYFKARELENKVLFFWATAWERDNEGFYLQSSKDGLAFENLAWVPGAGTRQGELPYSLEITPDPEDRYFRLKQVDFDGQYQLSAVLFMEGTGSPNSDIFQLLKENNSQIQIRNLTNENVRLQIVNLQGKVLAAYHLPPGDDLELEKSGTGVLLLWGSTSKSQQVLRFGGRR